MPRAPRNRTLTCSRDEVEKYSKKILQLSENASADTLVNRIIHGDFFTVAPFVPDQFIDLLIMDPPYNLTKSYNGNLFRSREASEYIQWFGSVVTALRPMLKRDASVYVCSDWRTSTLVYPVLARNFHVRNRITWEREKGRGAKTNWKNTTEDVWFCTVGNKYVFNVDAVKLKRKVVAPYRGKDRTPKDWEESADGNFRFTHPSNFWSDITIPFWSMPENTDHPTQKSEKLIAKLVLASSREGDLVFDPFLGSGTTAVVAKKLARNYCGIEVNKEYCCWALKRLELADADETIQGYEDGVFWERNSLSEQKRNRKTE